MSKTFTITPVNIAGDFKEGEIVGYTVNEISSILGFKPNVQDDPSKVKYSWGFMVDDSRDGVASNHRCGIWDYRGSWRERIYSTFGPHEVFKELFPPKE